MGNCGTDDGEDLALNMKKPGDLILKGGDWWVKAAEGKNTGDVAEADGRAEETEQNMTMRQLLTKCRKSKCGVKCVVSTAQEPDLI